MKKTFKYQIITSLFVLFSFYMNAQSVPELIYEADKLSRENQFTESLEAYQKALNIHTNRPDARGSAEFQNLLEKGITAKTDQRFYQAINFFEAAQVYAVNTSQETVLEIHKGIIFAELGKSITELESKLGIDRGQEGVGITNLVMLYNNKKEKGDDLNALHLAILGNQLKENIKASGDLTPQDELYVSFLDQTFQEALYNYYSKRWKIEKGMIKEVAFFTKNSKQFLVKAGNTSPLLFNKDNDNPGQLKGYTGDLQFVKINPKQSSSTLMLTGNTDNQIRLVDKSGDIKSYAFEESTRLTGASFSPDNQYILSFMRDKIAILQQLENMESKIILKGHEANILEGIFSNDSEKIATRDIDGMIKVWNTEGTQMGSMQHEGQVYGFEFAAASDLLLSWSADNTAKIWGTKGNLIYDLKGHTAPVITAAFNPDGNQIISGSADYTAILWKNGNPVKAIQHDHRVNGVQFSPDGRYALTYALNGQLKLWDLANDKITDLQAHQKYITAAQFSQSGNTFFTASEDGIARLWNLKGELLMEVDEFTAGITSATFSDDGNYLLLGSKDQSVVWLPTPAHARVLIEDLPPMDPDLKEQLNTK